MARVAIIYYSSTGGTWQLATQVERGAASTGCETRLRKARELAPDEAIDRRPGWREHLDATKSVPEAEVTDLDWADGLVFGSPARFGLPSAQLKQFIDQAGPLWRENKLKDKPVSVFGGASLPNGGQEAMLLALNTVFYHWGAIIVPVGYTEPIFAQAGGNPYGVGFTDPKGAGVPQVTLDAAFALGARLGRYTRIIAANRAALSADSGPGNNG